MVGFPVLIFSYLYLLYTVQIQSEQLEELTRQFSLSVNKQEKLIEELIKKDKELCELLKQKTENTDTAEIITARNEMVKFKIKVVGVICLAAVIGGTLITLFPNTFSLESYVPGIAKRFMQDCLGLCRRSRIIIQESVILILI
jgi:hypothetical protein